MENQIYRLANLWAFHLPISELPQFFLIHKSNFGVVVGFNPADLFHSSVSPIPIKSRFLSRRLSKQSHLLLSPRAGIVPSLGPMSLPFATIVNIRTERNTSLFRNTEKLPSFMRFFFQTFWPYTNVAEKDPLQRYFSPVCRDPPNVQPSQRAISMLHALPCRKYVSKLLSEILADFFCVWAVLRTFGVFISQSSVAHANSFPTPLLNADSLRVQ